MSSTRNIITRCPQCKTAFRVTHKVLNVASGTVRCGSCLRIFNAYDSIVQQEESPVSQQRPHTATSQPKASSSIQPKERIPLSDADDVDESWALALLDDEEANTNSDKNTAHTTPKTEPHFGEDHDNINGPSSTNHTENHLHSAPLDKDNEDLLENEIDTSNNISDKNTLLDTIELDPLELHEDSHSFPWLWFLGSTALILLLCIQIAWLRIDDLSTREPYREMYTKVCQLLPCKLPLQSNIDLIQASHLVIRSHPQEKNALVADAIIINNAHFEQVYPGLQLEFLNIHGDSIASRSFQPREYLKGELIDATVMPAKQPIQLSLAIVDPGESAVNYHIKIVPALPNNPQK